MWLMARLAISFLIPAKCSADQALLLTVHFLDMMVTDMIATF